MSLDATCWAWSVRAISPSQKLVLLALADRADAEHRCYPSCARLLADTGLDRKTLLAALRALEAAGAIQVERATGAVNHYRLLMERAPEDIHNQSQKRDRYQKRDQSQKRYGTSPKNGTPTSPKNGTQNLPLNLPRTSSRARAREEARKIALSEPGAGQAQGRGNGGRLTRPTTDAGWAALAKQYGVKLGSKTYDQVWQQILEAARH